MTEEKRALEVKELIADASRIEEDCLYSGKSQYNAARRWQVYHFILGISAALVTALSGIIVFNKWSIITAGALSFLASAIATTMTFLKPSERVEKHNNAGGLYFQNKNAVRMFANIDMLHTVDFEKERKMLHEYASKRDELNLCSLSFSRKDYERAKKNIEKGLAEYAIDKDKISE